MHCYFERNFLTPRLDVPVAGDAARSAAGAARG